MTSSRLIPGDTLIKIPKRKGGKTGGKVKGTPMPTGFVKRPMSQSYIEKRENARQALVMKRAGFTWSRICEVLGYNHESSASEAVKRELARSSRLEIQDWILLHIERTENMLNKLEKGIIKGEPRAVEVAVKVLERQAELIGLNYADRKEQAPEGARVEINILADPRDPDAQRFLDEIKSRAATIEGTPAVHSPLLPPATGDTQH